MGHYFVKYGNMSGSMVKMHGLMDGRSKSLYMHAIMLLEQYNLGML